MGTANGGGTSLGGGADHARGGAFISNRKRRSRLVLFRNPTWTFVPADKLTSPERLTALAEESHALAQIVAKNPSTPISLLRDLSRSEDEATRKSVITNPRAPYDVLSYLEPQSPA